MRHIFEFDGSKAFAYREDEHHYQRVEPNRQKQMARIEWGDLDEECRLPPNTYVVVPAPKPIPETEKPDVENNETKIKDVTDDGLVVFSEQADGSFVHEYDYKDGVIRYSTSENWTDKAKGKAVAKILANNDDYIVKIRGAGKITLDACQLTELRALLNCYFKANFISEPMYYIWESDFNE